MCKPSQSSLMNFILYDGSVGRFILHRIIKVVSIKRTVRVYSVVYKYSAWTTHRIHVALYCYVQRNFWIGTSYYFW